MLDNPVASRAMTEQAKARLGEWFSPRFLGAVLDDTYRGSSRRPRNCGGSITPSKDRGV
jgi:hypothetical protein